MPRDQPSRVDIVLVHSSDLHVDDEHHATKHHDGTAGLAAVLAAASAHNADIVLLAGDTFDNNRVPAPVLDRVGRLLSDAGMPVVILPGNHDPAMPNSVFERGGLASIQGVTDPRRHARRGHRLPGPRPGDLGARASRLREHGAVAWAACAHHAVADRDGTRPLRAAAQPCDAAAAVMAVQRRRDRRRPQADYLALGHWDRPERVGDGSVPAYYSGSPDLARTVNVIRLTSSGEVLVTREPLRWDRA